MKRNQKIKVAATQQQVYEAIMQKVMAQLNEEEMNELFGWGKGVEKPKQELTAEYVKSASSEELASTISEYINFWCDQSKDSLDKALSTAIVPLVSICNSSAELAKKVLNAITSAVRNGITTANNGAKTLPRLIVMGIALCIKMAANGIDAAKQYAQVLYQGVIKFAKETYAACVDKVEKGIDVIKDKITLLGKVSMALFMLVANKVTGAAQMCGDWVKEIVAAAKEKVSLAVLIVRSWFAVKSAEAKDAIVSLAGDVKGKVVEAYNAIDKKIRKGWNACVEKVIEWCDDVKITIAKLGEKVKDTMTATGDAIIGAKDKMVISGINKAIKALSSKYSEDDVVAIVRKAYNEGIQFNADGTCIINECYYSNTHLTRV